MATETSHAGMINRAVFCIIFFSNFIKAFSEKTSNAANVTARIANHISPLDVIWGMQLPARQ
jgi:hypothetical protein